MKTSAALAFLFLLVACGGGSTPPASSSPSSSSSSPVAAEAPSPAEPLPSGSHDKDGGSSSSAAADAGAAAPANPVGTEMKDDCTPVGVDFEKRARPKLKECYAQGKKKEPNLEGTVKIKVTVDVRGKIKSVKVIEKSLPDAVADCMVKVVKATPFPEVDKCYDASLTIPITFPTPK
jgi:TonB family protein